MTARPVRFLAIPVGLGLCAGFVDAVSFLHLSGVFPANQSGNAILLGIGLGGAEVSPLAPVVVAMAGFALGTFAGYATTRRLGVTVGRRAVLTVESLLLAGAAVAAWSLGDAPPGTGARASLLAGLAAVAMGLQTESLRRAAGVTVATTYQSGAIASFTEAVVDRLHGEPVAAPRRMLVLGSVLAAYVGGAAGGTALPVRPGPAMLLAAGAVAALLAACVLVPGLAPADAEVDRPVDTGETGS